MRRPRFGRAAVWTRCSRSSAEQATSPRPPSKLDGYDVIPTEARTALIAAGIDTVGDLGARKPTEVAALLKKEGVSASAATAAGWIAGARTVTLIR